MTTNIELRDSVPKSYYLDLSEVECAAIVNLVDALFKEADNKHIGVFERALLMHLGELKNKIIAYSDVKGFGRVKK